MVLDICQACGDEHEPPRGSKCKVVKAKATRRTIKSEAMEEETDMEESGGESVGDAMLKLSLGEPSDAQPKLAKRASEIPPDAEEIELRRLLEARVISRRKAELKAALEKEIAAEEKASRKKSASRKSRKKKKKKSIKKKSSSTSDSSDDSGESSPASSATSDAGDTDESRSGSSERRRKRRKKRSKFALDRFTKGKKSVNRLTFSELLYAALVWALKRAVKVDMDMDSLLGYIGHCAYMCMHATSNNYTDEAYRGYDHAVREKALEKGLRAFKMGDNSLSLLHFNMDTSRAHKSSGKSKTTYSNTGKETSTSSAKVKGVCYGHNYNKEGCTRSRCDWDHHCLQCKSKNHIVENCPEKKF